MPQVVQRGKGAQWVPFTPHTTSDVYSAIVVGPDKNVWFIDELAGAWKHYAKRQDHDVFGRWNLQL